MSEEIRIIERSIGQPPRIRVAAGLRQRFVTALTLAAVSVATILWLPTPALALALTPLVAMAAWEWAALAGLARPAPRAGLVLMVGLCTALAWFLLPPRGLALSLAPVALGWLALGAGLPRVRRIEVATGLEPRLIALGVLLLSATWIAIIALHRDAGPLAVLFLLSLIWLADTAAYFAGRRWGRRKLAPALSPGKTWEGAYGAMAAALAWSTLWVSALDLAPLRTLLAVSLCALTVYLSVIGDLFESWLKRRRGLKDAGALLPGHGGVLDRIDSMMAAAPVFVLGFRMLEVGL